MSLFDPDGKTAKSDGEIPKRAFGRHDVKVSILGLGGHHLGEAESVEEAIRIVHEAIDSGIDFFDNCWGSITTAGPRTGWAGR